MRHTLFIFLMLLLAASCRRREEQAPAPEPEVLMQVGDSTLTREWVMAQLPAGISSEDSTRLFDAVVEEWLEHNMLADAAQRSVPDLEKIDRLVEQYRRQLLAQEYRRLMATEYGGKVAPEAIKAEYDGYPDRYMLTAPVVKGIYVKLPDNSPQLGEVRTWLAKATPEAIDKLESYGLRGAMEYDYFVDQWVGWDELARRIPYRFPDPQAIAVKGKKWETSIDGITYMLHITDALPAGGRMPLDYATPAIEQYLLEKQRDDFDRRLLKDIYIRQLKEGQIKTGTYVPLRYRDLSDKK